MIAYVCLPLFWVGLLRLARVSLRKATIPSVLVYFIITFQYIGLPVLYFKLDDYRSPDIESTEVVGDIFLLTSTATTLVIIGFLASRVALRTDFATRALTRHHPEPANTTRLDTLGGVALTMLGAATLVIYIMKIGPSNLALVAAIEDPSDTLGINILRSHMGNAFEGRYYLYKLLMRDGLQIGSSTLFAVALLRPSKRRLLLFLISAVVATLSFTIATEKGPLINYLAGLMLVGLFIRSNGFLLRRWLFGTALAALGAVALLYMAFMGASDPLDAALQATSRLFTGQIEPLYHYLVIFPQQHDFLLGRSMPNPAGLLPFEHYPLTIEVMSMVHPWHLREGVVGSMPTFFWGELWANFGTVGVLLVPAFVGFAVCWIADTLDRFSPTPLTLAAIAWFSLHVKDLSNTPASNYIIDAYATAVVIGLIGFHLLPSPMLSRALTNTTLALKHAHSNDSQ